MVATTLSTLLQIHRLHLDNNLDKQDNPRHKQFQTRRHCHCNATRVCARRRALRQRRSNERKITSVIRRGEERRPTAPTQPTQPIGRGWHVSVQHARGGPLAQPSPGNHTQPSTTRDIKYTASRIVIAARADGRAHQRCGSVAGGVPCSPLLRGPRSRWPRQATSCRSHPAPCQTFAWSLDGLLHQQEWTSHAASPGRSNAQQGGVDHTRPGRTKHRHRHPTNTRRTRCTHATLAPHPRAI